MHTATAPTSEYFLALDQGTSSTRAIVFDGAGHIISSASAAVQCLHPQPGWVEQDPEQLITTAIDCGRRALAQSGIQAQHIRALGLTNQRETTVVWNRQTGQPIAPAIVWQDRRTAAACQALRDAGHDADIGQRTGLVADPYFCATKLRWLLDHTPGAQAAAERGELAFGTVDAWLLWHLTRLSASGVHASDITNASRTMLLNIHTGDWDDKLLSLFNIPRAMLPAVRPSAGLFGHTHADVFGAPIAITAMVGDQQGALFGQGCTRAGEVKNTYGTGCFMLMHTGGAARASAHGLITTCAAGITTAQPMPKHPNDPSGVWSAAHHGAALEYALEGSVFTGGSLVAWLRDGLGIIDSSAAVEPLAQSVPDSAGVSLVPAFNGLGAPHWASQARAAIVGLSAASTRAHIARAALEAIALQSADLLHAMQADAPDVPITALRVDGGASVNNTLMQFQADILGLPVIRAACVESTALGAARLAALGAGSSATLAADDAAERIFEPRMSADEAAARLARWHRAVRSTIELGAA